MWSSPTRKRWSSSRLTILAVNASCSASTVRSRVLSFRNRLRRLISIYIVPSLLTLCSDVRLEHVVSHTTTPAGRHGHYVRANAGQRKCSKRCRRAGEKGESKLQSKLYTAWGKGNADCICSRLRCVRVSLALSGYLVAAYSGVSTDN